MAQDAMAPAVFITEEYVTFDDVLEGKLGPREAGAAHFWVEQGSIIEPPAKDSNWISTDAPAGCYDTRVWDPIEDGEDAGTAANIGDASGFPAPAPQKAKTKTAPKVRAPAAAGQNMYTKAAFIGHSDTLGTLARRKARSSKDANDIESDEEAPEDAAASRAANEAIEKLPPSAALGKLPAGWRVKDLVLDGPRNIKILDGRLYISPSGLVCRTYENAKAMSKAEKIQCRWTYDVKCAISWIKCQATASRADLKANVDVAFPRYFVALQRRKAAIKPKSRSGTRMASKSRKGKEQEGPGVAGGNESRDDRALKRKASSISTPSSGRAGSEKPASGEKSKKKKKVVESKIDPSLSHRNPESKNGVEHLPPKPA